MLFMEKEVINIFRINLGAIGRGNDNVCIEIEYEKKKENKAKVEYSIGVYDCTFIKYAVGYYVEVKEDDDIEEVLFEDVRRLYESGYFDSSISLLYEEIDCLQRI